MESLLVQKLCGDDIIGENIEISKWKNSFNFLMAIIGAVIGLGNIWRFSYLLYSNGGGAFFIPYTIAILIMGIPFLLLEYGRGAKFKDSLSNILKSINPSLENNWVDNSISNISGYNLLCCTCWMGFHIFYSKFL